MPSGARTACLLVSNIFPPALGGSSQVYAALASCADGGIAVLTSSHDHQSGDERPDWKIFDRDAPYPVHRVKCVRPFLRKSGSAFGYRIQEVLIAVRLVLAVTRLALRYRAQAICIADDETVGWLTLWTQYVLKRRTLIYCHGDDLKCPPQEIARRRRWFGVADGVVAASHYAAKLLVSEFSVSRDKITVIQNGVDLKAFQPRVIEPQFLKQNGFEGRRLLVTVTRLVPRKGVDKVLQALPAIARKFPDLLYVIAGDGPQRQQLQEMAQTLEIAPLVRFVGAVPHSQTGDFYNAADLVLLVNREEDGEADGLPLVFLEANACGKPVIGGKAGGTPEIVRDGENGLLVDGRDVGEIEQAVCALMGDDARRTSMGERALQIARSNGWDRRANDFLAACAGR